MNILNVVMLLTHWHTYKKSSNRWFVSVNVSVVHGLKLKEMLVPRYADIRESVTLGCQFDLGGRRLYSVKWYKDEFEFFRFMPDNRPQTQVFPLEGITLDVSYILLRKITILYNNILSVLKFIIL